MLVCVLPFLPSLSIAEEPEPIYGFTTSTSTAQREWEKKFKALPDPQIIRETMRRLGCSGRIMSKVAL